MARYGLKASKSNFTGVSDPYEAPENPEIEICCDGKKPLKETPKNY